MADDEGEGWCWERVSGLSRDVTYGRRVGERCMCVKSGVWCRTGECVWKISSFSNVFEEPAKWMFLGHGHNSRLIFFFAQIFVYPAATMNTDAVAEVRIIYCPLLFE